MIKYLFQVNNKDPILTYISVILVSLLLALNRCFSIDNAVGKKCSWSDSDAHIITVYRIYSKLTVKTPKRRHRRHLVSFFLLTLSRCQMLFYCFYCWLWIQFCLLGILNLFEDCLQILFLILRELIYFETIF